MLALLTDFAGLEPVQQRVRDAISHANPATRAAAARVAAALGLQSAAPVLVRNLSVETDPLVAQESVLALVLLGRQPMVQLAEPAVVRLGGGVAGLYVHALAAQRAETLLTLSPELRAAVSTASLGDALAQGTLNAPDMADQAANLAREAGSEAWVSFLDARLRADARPTQGVVAGLDSADEVIRRATAWHVASFTEFDTDAADRPRLLAPLAATAERTGRGSPEALAATLAARAARIKSARERNWTRVIASWAEAERMKVAAQLSLESFLRDDERKALKGTTDKAPKTEWSPRLLALFQAAGSNVTRTLGTYPAGFVASTVAEAGCRPPPNATYASAVTYRPDGRPMAIEPALTESVPCGAVVRALARTALLLPFERLAGRQPHLLFMFLDADAIRCHATLPGYFEGDSRSSAARIAPETVVPPEKVHNVPPTYPVSAQRARIQGVVLLRGLISTAGCVAYTEVQRSIVPALDHAALNAVRQWRYTPMTVRGQPVPVSMSITLNFKLP